MTPFALRAFDVEESTDLERITRACEAAPAPGTHKIYQYAWAQWATWCAEHGFEPLPADLAAMCAFMTQHVADGLAVISLGPFISVINHVHSAHGVPNPHENRAVRQVRDGLRRAYGVAPHRCPDRHKDLSVLFDRYIRPGRRP